MSNPAEAAEPAHWGPPDRLYLGSADDDLAIKTARELAYWRPDWCVGQFRRPDFKPTLGLPELTMTQTHSAGADTMVIGAANAGGVMSPEIVADAVAALDVGLNVAAPLHQKLRETRTSSPPPGAMVACCLMPAIPCPAFRSAPLAHVPAAGCLRWERTARLAGCTPRWHSNAPCVSVVSSRIFARPAKPAFSSPDRACRLMQ